MRKLTRMVNSKSLNPKWYRRFGFFSGPLVATIIFFFFRPDGLPMEASCVAAIASWMAIWWATEAVHVAVTAFLPMILFPITGVGPISEVSKSYAHPIIYLFLGGFVMALAIEKSGLHLRAALRIFRLAGVNARGIVAGFMIAAAVISMWISNTSTTIMMLPIAMSVVFVVRDSISDVDEKEMRNFELAIFLGLAYGATIGGVSTLVGTPPNAFLSGFMESTYNTEIDFARWMIIGVPLAIIMLPICWFVLVRILFPIDFTASERTLRHLEAKDRELGSVRKAEVRVGLLFLLLVSGWLFRKPLIALTGAQQLTDTGIAMIAAVAAFIIPSGDKDEGLMTWEDTKKLPWGILVLFGGGLALASGMASSELTSWLGKQLSPLGQIHVALLIVAACALVIFLTELTSNLATTATFLPIMAALALETGNDPLVFLAPVTLASSFAFMLPVATPPNAIVFSSGKVSIPEMMRAGFVLNIIGVIVLTLVAVFLVPIVF